MKHILTWAKAFAMTWGGVGLFVVAFIDSSFLSLPEINDILVIWLVIQHKELMLYYAAMATLGSLAGCFVVYGIGRKGGDTLMSKRLSSRKAARSLAALQRYGLLAILVPALLPPPAPFKIFVLLAGVARVSITTFTLAVVLGRGLRYVAVGLLAVRYGDAALEYLRENVGPVGIALSAVVLVGALAYMVWKRRTQPPQDTATDSSSSSISAD